MAEPLPQLFGVIPTGAPCITRPTSAPSPTSFVYVLPTGPKPFSHIGKSLPLVFLLLSLLYSQTNRTKANTTPSQKVVFLLPGITLPPSTAAAVYISLPTPPTNPPSSQPPPPTFKFLGGIGPGKESAVFKISGLGNASSSQSAGGGGGIAEVDMDADETSPATAVGGGGEITLGISLESADSVSSQMAALQSQSQPSTTSSALVLANSAAGGNNNNSVKKPNTLLLAQRIIKNAFNFLASFSGNVNGGVEVVPLKAFEEWWRKFEGRVRSDPGFLERSDGD
ncbi:hypothetical protein ONS95_010979 [Cadophora gregata]|uniref:uncharacterized protein n=1 Tax=Cadophora gregata TaxID=51156 RepID=UPI0026DCCA9F|nr:uncharacterized protein ONS95_010979 [Cadophora gregata]KAK0119539.1 hypothetical protein ONS95_010979 [Cadophora gregata]